MSLSCRDPEETFKNIVEKVENAGDKLVTSNLSFCHSVSVTFKEILFYFRHSYFIVYK